MAGENAPTENGQVGNGNVPSAAAEPTAPQKAAAATESFITSIVLTIFDVIVFLAVSIGYICQVSSHPLKTNPSSHQWNVRATESS